MGAGGICPPAGRISGCRGRRRSPGAVRGREPTKTEYHTHPAARQSAKRAGPVAREAWLGLRLQADACTTGCYFSGTSQAAPATRHLAQDSLWMVRLCRQRPRNPWQTLRLARRKALCGCASERTFRPQPILRAIVGKPRNRSLGRTATKWRWQGRTSPNGINATQDNR